MKKLIPKKKYGRWSVIKDASNRGNKRFVLCRCECGTEKEVALHHLSSGASTSCGCYRAENPSSATHNESGTPLHNVWVSMRNRTTCKTATSWKRYGGRGIKVSYEWDKYEDFRDWALDNSYEYGLQIDRIDNDGDYSPDNCRFVECKINMRNKNNNRMITLFGETKTLAEWVDEPICKAAYDTVWARLKSGWSAEKAITQEVR